MDKCPKCGAELVPSGDGFKHYACGTMTRFDGCGVEGEQCLRRQLAAVTKERDALKAKLDECRAAWRIVEAWRLGDVMQGAAVNGATDTLNRNLGGE